MQTYELDPARLKGDSTLSKTIRAKILLALALLTIVGCSGLAVNAPEEQSNPPIWAVKGEVLVTNRLDVDFSKYMVTFIELGADRCIPCKKMQPIMKEIAAAFPDRVQVVFYDVWKDPAPAEKYGIQLIPTQVFIDRNGREVFRHVGLFPKDEILKMFAEKGIL